MDEPKGGGYGSVQREVMRSKTLPPQAKALYALLCSYAGNKSYCFPSVNALCEDLGLSKPMVVKYLALLDEQGIIIKSRNKEAAQNNAHKYIIVGSVKSTPTPAKPEIVEPIEEPKSKADLTFEDQKLSTVNLEKLNTLNLGGKASLTFLYKGRIITLEKEHIQKDVCDFFKVKESNARSYMQICKMISYLFATNQIEYFFNQFENYKSYKSASKEKIHHFETFIGNETLNYADGAWTKQDWGDSLKQVQCSTSTPVPVFNMAGRAQKQAIKDVD